MSRPITSTQFRVEAERRLIDTWTLMTELGLRSKQSVWTRVDKGTLPKPVLVIPNTVALWDRDEIASLAVKNGRKTTATAA